MLRPALAYGNGNIYVQVMQLPRVTLWVTYTYKTRANISCPQRANQHYFYLKEIQFESSCQCRLMNYPHILGGNVLVQL